MSDDMLERDKRDLEGLASRVDRLEHNGVEVVKRLDNYAALFASTERAVDKLQAIVETAREVRLERDQRVNERITALENSMRDAIENIETQVTDFIKESREDRKATTEFMRRLWLLLIGLAFSSTAGFIATYFWKGVNGPGG